MVFIHFIFLFFSTVSRLDAPVESLEDLSKQYKIQYAPQKGSAAWIYFDRMAHIEHKFYEYIQYFHIIQALLIQFYNDIQSLKQIPCNLGSGRI